MSAFSREELDAIEAELERQRPDAVAAFLPRLQQYVPGTTAAEVMRDTKAIDPDYPWSGVANFLFRYFGKELLPVVIPEAKIGHARVDEVGEAISTTFDNKTALPMTVDNYPLHDIAACAGEAVYKWTVDRRGQGRIARVKGLCSQVSFACIEALQGDFTDLQAEYVRLGDEAARRDVGYNGYNLRPLGMGHSLFRIAAAGADAYISIDPTVAQVDQSEDYDLELASVPRDSFADFARLRYRMHADARVTTRVVKP